MCVFFFLNDPAPTEIYTLPLHDALPISVGPAGRVGFLVCLQHPGGAAAPSAGAKHTGAHWIGHAAGVGDRHPYRSVGRRAEGDRKSTRLNSSHGYISYAVFCLKKKKQLQAHALVAGTLLKDGDYWGSDPLGVWLM